VLYGSSDPVVWAPWRTDAEVIVEPAGLSHVSLTQVTEAVERLRKRHEGTVPAARIREALLAAVALSVFLMMIAGAMNGRSRCC